ncbi:sphingosine N-acyltransferase lag1 [Mortierella alpina]|nr:sphingosine N-acyltransferase lag1 [Mortierella alpina]
MVIAFTYIRAVFMKSIFNPLGKWLGVRNSKLERFEEQMYIMLYYVISWTCGMILMYNSPYWVNTDHYLVEYPNQEMCGALKAYYLIELGFWVQQIYVVNTDSKRKDYLAMLLHHFLTCTLIGLAYALPLTRAGNAVMVLMDISDVFLAIAKVLKYLGYSTICDAFFGLFVASWVITRHYLFPLMIMLFYNKPQQFLDTAWDLENSKFLTVNVQSILLVLLLGLECILCYWLFMISKVIYQMFNGAAANDNRSHDEGSEEENEAEVVMSLAIGRSLNEKK